jgi:hypothetical protein
VTQPHRRLPISRASAVLLVSLCALCACADEAGDDVVGDWADGDGWVLPDAIREVSGLATDNAGQLYLHDDEIGQVYRLDPATGAVITVAKIHEPPLRADFEGIALLEDDIWLVTSKAKLYRIIDGRKLTNAVVDSTVFQTGLKKICEVEGLDDFGGKLVMACKTNYNKADENAVLLYFFDPVTQTTEIFLRLSLEKIGQKHFSPSALVVTADKVYLLGAKQRRLIVVDHAGALLATHKLAKLVHPQAEGLGIYKGQIYIADEGSSRGGRIASYSRIKDTY